MTIAKIIKGIRSTLCITQEQLAHDLNISFSTINRWENGHSVPSRLARMKLVDYCSAKEINDDLMNELHKL